MLEKMWKKERKKKVLLFLWNISSKKIHCVLDGSGKNILRIKCFVLKQFIICYVLIYGIT